MSDYVRVYNLTIKDSLPTGNSNKVIKGTELDVELNAVAAAISSKADINGPTFTGTPSAPTASFGTSTAQLATTAFVQAALQAIYPVGSIYTNATVSTNPATLLGFGTWTAFAEGKVLVGLNASDTDFDTLEETGGSKSSVASHTHTYSGSTGAMSTNASHAHSVYDPGHSHQQMTHSQYGYGENAHNTGDTGGNDTQEYDSYQGYSTRSSGTGIGIYATNTDHTHTYSGTTASTGSSNGNLQPYVVVKMWKRTA